MSLEGGVQGFLREYPALCDRPGAPGMYGPTPAHVDDLVFLGSEVSLSVPLDPILNRSHPCGGPSLRQLSEKGSRERGQGNTIPPII